MERNFQLTLVASLFLSGCSSDNPFLDSVQEAEPGVVIVALADTVTVVTTDVAAKVAGRFAAQSPSRSITPYAEEVLTVSDSLGTPLYYVVNYAADQGYVIVSASKDYYPVLAYSDHGRYEPEVAANTAASIIMAPHEYLISHVESIPDSIVMRSHLQWESLLQEEQTMAIDSRGVSDALDLMHAYMAQWRNEGYTVYYYTEFKRTAYYTSMPEYERQRMDEEVHEYAYRFFPTGQEEAALVRVKETFTNYNIQQLLTTEWGQCVFYGGPYDRMKVGCAPVALGQVMRFYDWPERYDWGSMDMKTSGYMSLDANDFFTDIISTGGATLGIEETSMNMKQIKKALTDSKFGYSNITNVSHSINTVNEQLTARHPVLMTGNSASGQGAHVWICDGRDYHQGNATISVWCVDDVPMESIIPDNMMEAYNYVMYYTGWDYHHMNLGYFGEGNGYYIDSNMAFKYGTQAGSGTVTNYTKSREDIINVYPVR